MAGDFNLMSQLLALINQGEGTPFNQVSTALRKLLEGGLGGSSAPPSWTDITDAPNMCAMLINAGGTLNTIAGNVNPFVVNVYGMAAGHYQLQTGTINAGSVIITASAIAPSGYPMIINVYPSSSSTIEIFTYNMSGVAAACSFCVTALWK